MTSKDPSLRDTALGGGIGYRTFQAAELSVIDEKPFWGVIVINITVSVKARVPRANIATFVTPHGFNVGATPRLRA